jgi:hypothetical protein
MDPTPALGDSSRRIADLSKRQRHRGWNLRVRGFLAGLAQTRAARSRNPSKDSYWGRRDPQTWP